MRATRRLRPPPRYRHMYLNLTTVLVRSNIRNVTAELNLDCRPQEGQEARDCDRRMRMLSQDPRESRRSADFQPTEWRGTGAHNLRVKHPATDPLPVQLDAQATSSGHALPRHFSSPEFSLKVRCRSACSTVSTWRRGCQCAASALYMR